MELSNSSAEKSERLLETLQAEKEHRLTTNRLQYYKPYDRQLAFHNAGAKYRERMLCAANQSGKTFCAGMEAAMHATGIPIGSRANASTSQQSGGRVAYPARLLVQPCNESCLAARALSARAVFRKTPFLRPSPLGALRIWSAQSKCSMFPAACP